MLVLPDYNKPYIIDSLTAPVVIKHNWIFNAIACDFMLSPITYLEETTGGTVKVRINGTEFWMPSTWHILVTDTETYQIDTVNIQTCASKQHVAYSFSPDEMNVRVLDVMILDAIEADTPETMSLVHPMIAKGTALVHPVGPAGSTRVKLAKKSLANGGNIDGASYQVPGEGPQLSVVIGPHDLYKYLTNKVVGDIFSF